MSEDETRMVETKGAPHVEVVTDESGLRRCWDIRMEVFVHEQNVPPEEEIDALDTDLSTVHLIATVDGVDVGTLRVLPEKPGYCHIGRVAVRRAARATGIGYALMSYAERVALDRCADSDGVVIALSSQEQAVGFYEKCGYRLLAGERYLDAGIWHRDMQKTLRIGAAKGDRVDEPD
ncbi:MULTISPECIES: GNAT family N-acetyltransferase [unclassified Actinobaculum]|uniref:GNAT family N-acetyltransferase n=1 Tax=unclassified Actinobaculum TaxID=2609299 RepID=UPI000D5288EC|nr:MULTISPECIES: GNAT family N-acetyltransferase [unclassified Actinobaculum]AWE42586.1 GNAT family N-acetyltransferase [Actinobaculum sp. 313]RTE48122.1 GNAT family N-acetyltransferase [Actinobaculum sp. 352]